MCRSEIQHKIIQQSLNYSKSGLKEVFLTQDNKVKVGEKLVAQINYPYSSIQNQFQAEFDTNMLERGFTRSFRLQPGVWQGEAVTLYAFKAKKVGKTRIRLYDSSRIDESGKSAQEFVFDIEILP